MMQDAPENPQERTPELSNQNACADDTGTTVNTIQYISMSAYGRQLVSD